MAKGKFIPEETKKEIARRKNNGEDAESLSSEFNVAAFSVGKWARQYKNSNSKPKRKITTKKVTRRPNVAQIKIKELEGQVEFWREKYTSLLYERGK